MLPERWGGGGGGVGEAVLKAFGECWHASTWQPFELCVGMGVRLPRGII